MVRKNSRRCRSNALVPKQAQSMACNFRISRQGSCNQSVGNNEAFRQYLWRSKVIRQWVIN